jgi:hypothetical protein
MIEEPDALQSSILAAFGYKVAEGRMLLLDECRLAGDEAPKKRGRPKGSKNKGQAAEAPKRRGRPPKHLLGTDA